MSAVEALALAHAEGVRVSLAGDWFIRWQSPGELPPHVRSALTAAKPEIVDLLRRFRLDETWALDATGGNDDARLLAKLAALDFRVRFYGAQAALDDDAGQGRVPPMPLLYQLRERQPSTAHCCAPFRLPTCGRRASDDEVPVMEAAPRVYLHPSVDSTVSARGFRAVARRRSKR